MSAIKTFLEEFIKLNLHFLHYRDISFKLSLKIARSEAKTYTKYAEKFTYLIAF